jgi:hypothetical protein
MRLILRGAAARLATEGSVVVAASPDSLARQPWQWDVRVSRDPVGQSQQYDGAGIGHHHICVRSEDALVSADLSTLRIVEDGGPVTFDRPDHELWLAVVEHGTFRHGSFEVAPGDVLVWEGDDPLSIDLTPTGRGSVECALVSLRRTDGAALPWVP